MISISVYSFTVDITFAGAKKYCSNVTFFLSPSKKVIHSMVTIFSLLLLNFVFDKKQKHFFIDN